MSAHGGIALLPPLAVLAETQGGKERGEIDRALAHPEAGVAYGQRDHGFKAQKDRLARACGEVCDEDAAVRRNVISDCLSVGNDR